jgi:hypothetical protein
MVLGNNVKHLVIVIPNEGHHGLGEDDEARFIAQPFFPQIHGKGLGLKLLSLMDMWVMNTIF